MYKSICGKSVLALTLLLMSARAAYGADISLLSDISAIESDFMSFSLPTTEALIIQNGSANVSTINQSGAVAGTGNYSEIDQEGSSNQASVMQNGAANNSRVIQSGADNYASVTQIGNVNSVDLAQAGDAYLTATQIGNYNAIVSTQAVQNTATLSETGNNNTINLNVTTPGLNVNIGITGNGMTVSRVY
jgi:hypothetical protein